MQWAYAELTDIGERHGTHELQPMELFNNISSVVACDM